MAGRFHAIHELSRFAVSGVIVALFYFATASGLIAFAPLPDQASLAIAYCSALALHFTLNRRFVFAKDGAFSLRRRSQGLRYLLLAATAYGITAAALATLPEALDVSTTVVYIVTALLVSAANFVILRHWVFHSEPLIEHGGTSPQSG